MSLKLNISINEIHEVKICLNFIRPPCILLNLISKFPVIYLFTHLVELIILVCM